MVKIEPDHPILEEDGLLVRLEERRPYPTEVPPSPEKYIEENKVADFGIAALSMQLQLVLLLFSKSPHLLWGRA